MPLPVLRPARLLPFVASVLAGCAEAPDPAADDTAPPVVAIPGHDDCLPEGEVMTEETCLAVVEADGRFPTVSEDKSGLEGLQAEARAADPELEWLTGQLQRCTCACCHTERWGGPGVYFWDLDFRPVWIDSASNWSLSVLGGWTKDPPQTFPLEDLERVRAYIESVEDYRREH